MDFSYLDGELEVVHRRLGPDGWEAADGAITGRSLLGGRANVAEVSMGGTALGVSLKALDPATGTWTAWWVSAATGQLGPPMRGRWVDGRIRLAGLDHDGTLCADVVSAVTETSAHWEQSRSTDGGLTWVPEWTMEMTRRPAP